MPLTHSMTMDNRVDKLEVEVHKISGDLQEIKEAIGVIFARIGQLAESGSKGKSAVYSVHPNDQGLETSRLGVKKGGFHARFAWLEFPKFRGDEATRWLYRAKQFFNYHGTEETQKEGLSVFNMDNKSNGITWISNIYQKMEVMFQELGQELETGCDKVLKFCTEVIDDLLHPADDSDNGCVSDMSLMHDVEARTPTKLDHFVSLRRCSSAPTLSHGPYDMNLEQAYDALTEKSNPILEEVIVCDDLEKEGEVHNGHSDLCFPASSAHSCASLPVTDVIGSSNDLELKEAFVSTNVNERSVEAEEEFENLKLKNSSQERKKRSDKKKLGDVFFSKMPLTEKNDQEKLEIQSINAKVETDESHEEISTSSTLTEEDKTSNKLLTQETCESDWELL